MHLIMFTSHLDDDSIFTALAAGADGYCSKETSSSELAAAIETVYRGAIWLPPAIANRVLRNVTAQAETTIKTAPANVQLQPREIEILSQIVQGKSGDEIAGDLKLEPGTVLSEMHHVIDKLARSDRARAALNAMRNFSPDEPELAQMVCQKCGARFSSEARLCAYDGTSLTPLSDDPLIGTVFADRYDIMTQIGVGGMSTVYKARHKFMGSHVAIKILAPRLVPDLKNIKRFRQEAQVTSTLTHPNIVTAHDFGITPQGQIFLIMDYIEGRTLAAVIEEQGSLPLDRALNIFVQLCDALEHAHRRKVIHRDLKPGNIIISQDEDGEHVKVVDFGIAKISRDIGPHNGSLTVQGEVFGSPVYMSPEQCTDSSMDQRSDLYSLGCLMFESLTGCPPFCGSNTCETIRQQVFETTPAMQDVCEHKVPGQLEQVVRRCLEKDPASRFKSAGEVREELMRCRSTA
jgi:tRNA A-37 threonylcarbamoyl transferase component Bud32/DNA-binding CsgD family transcriptional regulator